jgi:aspartate dehydrogenase
LAIPRGLRLESGHRCQQRNPRIINQRFLKIALLGCGNIGGIIVNQHTHVELVALYDRNPERSRALASRIAGVRVCANFEEFIQVPADIVVEAASPGAVREYGEAIVQQGRDLVVLSVGALADNVLTQRLCDMASRNGRKIRIPSGALFGLDNIKIGRISSFDTLTLRTVKPPQSLDMEARERTLLFRGSAAECIRHYPRNINVAVALSLAAGCEVDVELWVDPGVTRNTHEVIARGEFGEADIVIRNVPCPENPATSYLAALSVLTLLRDIDDPLVIGT